MADFYQTGVISTLHRLGAGNIERLEKDLKKHSRANPVALVLPCLYSELQGEAVKRIVEELKKVAYLKQIVVTLGRAEPAEFAHAKQFFAALPQEHWIVWNDGERLRDLYTKLEQNEISAGPDGKGRSVWMALGFVLADEKAQVIALHDADILTYTRELPARLCYPVVNPNLAYEYAKGYYARFTDRFHGRVTRLFVTPLVRTLQRVVGFQPFLVFLDSFRYPLAGEFAMTEDLARTIRIPSDWGLEIGLLGEIFRNCATRRVCEVDLCETYEHKHQALSREDPSTGLMRMAVDIAKSLFRTLASEGIPLSEGTFRSLKAAYLRAAQDTIKKYDDDAAINALAFDRHAEATAVDAFAQAIDLAAKQVLEDPLGAPLIPNWSRVTSAMPDFLENLKAAVVADNQP